MGSPPIVHLNYAYLSEDGSKIILKPLKNNFDWVTVLRANTPVVREVTRRVEIDGEPCVEVERIVALPANSIEDFFTPSGDWLFEPVKKGVSSWAVKGTNYLVVNTRFSAYDMQLTRMSM